MDDWNYCQQTLPKVSRTFALNISVLKGELHRSVLIAYLFCRIVDTVEDAAKLEPKVKIRLLLQFSKLIQDAESRSQQLSQWVQDCAAVDGSASDLELLMQTPRVFRVFDTLKENHRAQIIHSVTQMAQGMAFFQEKFTANEITLLKDEEELEEYCYFVAGAVGEMLSNLFIEELPGLSDRNREIMQAHAVSFGLGLQMTNISKDIMADRGRGWSYIPRSFITEKGLTVEDFNTGVSGKTNMEILERLLHKTTGHLQDALKFTLAIPKSESSIRIFCIWPLWMALETVATLHNNEALLKSDDPVKISRQTVRKILRRTRLLVHSDTLLKWSFSRIQKRARLFNPPVFRLHKLKSRLEDLNLNSSATLNA